MGLYTHCIIIIDIVIINKVKHNILCFHLIFVIIIYELVVDKSTLELGD